MPDDSLRLAVLIDADNASASVIGDILSEVASLGTASVKRVYGDFTTSNLHGWRTVLLEHAIQPVQQFRNTVGKNASDSAHHRRNGFAAHAGIGGLLPRF
jgi:hypothetical protein